MHIIANYYHLLIMPHLFPQFNLQCCFVGDMFSVNVLLVDFIHADTLATTESEGASFPKEEKRFLIVNITS